MLIKTFLFVLAVEMGDKTQLLLAAVAAKHKTYKLILVTAAAVILLNAGAVFLGSSLGTALPVPAIKLAAGVMFLCFALSSLSERFDAKDGQGCCRESLVLVFCTFFLAELGDKTQLMIIALSAEAGKGKALPVFFGACGGLMAADLIGIFAGLALKKKLPRKSLWVISFAVFSSFGIITLLAAMSELTALPRSLLWGFGVIVSLAFVFVAYLLYTKKERKRKHAKIPAENKPLSLF